MSIKGKVDRHDVQYRNFIRAVNSDTASAESMLARITKFRATVPEGWQRELFDNVAFDNFMLDTETQRQRRLSGEFDSFRYDPQ